MNNSRSTRVSSPRGLVVCSILALSALSGGCWFSANHASNNDRPTTDRDPGTRRGGGDSQDSQIVADRTPIPIIADLDRENFSPPQPKFVNTAKGLTLAFEPRRVETLLASTTRIRLAIPHRSPIGDPAGAATLCAEVVASAPQTIGGKGSLRYEIDHLGGELEVRVDGSATTFAIDVRTTQWEQALRLLVEAIRNNATQRQIEEVQSRVLHDLEEQALRDPLGLAMHQILTTRVINRHPLHLMQDLSPQAVNRFRRETYRPIGSVLAVSSPHNAGHVFRQAKVALGTWHRDAPDAPAVSIDNLARPLGVFWAPTADTPRASADPSPLQAALMFELTPLTIPKTVEFHVALEIFAAGPDSLLARRLRTRLGYDVPMKSEWIENGPAQIFVVRMPLAAPEVVNEIQTAIDETLQQMAVTRPSSGEIRDAAARVRLRFLRDQDRPSRSLTVLVREAMLNRQITAQLFTTPFQELDSGISLDIEAAVGLLLFRRPTIVVSGGQPPESVSGKLVTLGTVIQDVEGPDYGDSREEQLEQALPYLDLAMIAVGGKKQLANFDSFHGAARVRSGRGPDAIDLIAYDRKSRRVRRVRKVLGTLVDTLLEPDSATQQVGIETVALTAVEAKAIRDRIETHPLRILSEVARGDAKFRLLSIRRRAGRSLAVLEREESGSSRLRMHVDSESGLVRVIESTEQRPGAGSTAVTHEYRDYRNVRGLRAPFIVTQRIDGTDVGSITLWSEFVPSKPEDIYFDRSVWP